MRVRRWSDEWVVEGSAFPPFRKVRERMGHPELGGMILPPFAFGSGWGTRVCAAAGKQQVLRLRAPRFAQDDSFFDL
jgi:hypothetical protein